ncbi:hypothetical protein ACFO0N_14960 [Halobium salinum]|uniref:CARDB domain-containing protein n=1 Tax=Halobium salinum TaxID=1364940 RepID=A0ABD5PEE6_9EURY|nr:hypothetical protein [Halobium salinum]
MGINTILVLVGALMFAGLIGTLFTNSPLEKAIWQGQEITKKNSDFTIEIKGDGDITPDQQLSDLALYVYHRASNDGCAEGPYKKSLGLKGPTVWKQNNNKIKKWRNGVPQTANDGEGQAGYPGLKGSYLTQYPKCYGAEDTGIRVTEGSATGKLGQDMEGIYSREYFEIKGKKKVVLIAGNEQSSGSQITGSKPSKDRGDTWLEKNFILASKTSFKTRTASCQSDEKFHGTRQNFALYFNGDVPDNRAGVWMSDSPKKGGIGDKQPYCGDKTKKKPHVDPFLAGSTDKPASVILCPGDKGYIQMNKGKDPTNDGEAGETVGSSIEESGEAAKYGFIQITELGKNCADDRAISIENAVNIYSSKQTQRGRLLTEVSVESTYGIPKEVELVVIDSKGNQIKGAQAEIPAAGQKTLTAANGPFKASLCSVDVEIRQGGATVDKVEDLTPVQAPQECDDALSEYDAKLRTVSKEIVTDLFGTEKLRVHARIANTGRKGGSYYNLRMQYTSDKHREARFSNMDLEPGQTTTNPLTVTKKFGAMDDCKVEIQAWVEPVGVTDTHTIDLSTMDVDGC